MELEYRLEAIAEVARWFWEQAGDSRVFAFHGEMGAGKTTLIQSICRVRGVGDEMGSPTFSIINEYRSGEGVTIYHMDLYRLRSAEEAVQAGVEDCLYSGDFCLVEWPERAEGIFPPGTVDVYLEVRDSQSRKLQIGRN